MSFGVSGAFNTGSGTRIKINSLVEMLQKVSGIKATIEYSAPRPGDVKHSLADISLANSILNFSPNINFEVGLTEYINWAKIEINN